MTGIYDRTIGFTTNVLDTSGFWKGTLHTEDSITSRVDVFSERLAVAARQGMVKEVSLLIRNGANVNWEKHNSNQTPLLLAAAWGHLEVCELLLSAGAKTDVRHRISKNSPLDYALTRSGMRSDPEDPNAINLSKEKKATYRKIALLLAKALPPKEKKKYNDIV